MSAVSQDYNSRFQVLNISRLSQKVLMQFRHMTLVTPWHCVLIFISICVVNFLSVCSR